jgi:ribose transport system permease protein
MGTHVATPTTPSNRPTSPLREWTVRTVRSRAVLGIVALAALIVYFTLEAPDTFLTVDNMKTLLVQQTTLIILALGVTVVLLIGEFDLSFANTVGLTGAVVVLLMSNRGWSAGSAMAVAVLVGLFVGTGNGVAIAYGRAPAFIATLAAGSVLAGAEALLTDNKTISEHIPTSYLNFSLTEHLGLPWSTWCAIVLTIVVALVLSFTTYGRRVRATGINPVATVLAGVNISLVRISAFALLGGLAGLAGVVVTSQAGSYFPNSSIGLLLPPYSAVFLGAAVVGRGRFSAPATIYGIAFIALLERGLTIMNKPAAMIDVIEGGVLLIAVLLASLERRS